MIELFAYDQRYNKQYLLDIENAGAVSLNYEVGKAGDLVGRNSPYSQSFNLPFSSSNNKFFRQFYNINVQTDVSLGLTSQPEFDADVKTNCGIHVDGVPIISGTLQLISCSLEQEVYQIAVLGNEASLFRAIQEKKLIDAFNNGGVLDTSYNVDVNDANVIDSWTLSNDVTQGGVGNGIIIFPLIDYGNVGDYNFIWLENNSFANYGLAEANFLQAQDLKPAIQLKALFEKIISAAGFTLTNNAFLTSDAFTKAYMTLGTDRESMATTTLHQSQVANTASTNIQTWGSFGVGFNTWQSILFPTQTGAGASNNPPSLYDVNDDWDVAGTYVFPYTGAYNGVFTATFDTGPSSLADGAIIKLAVEGSVNTTTLSPNIDLAGNNGGSAIISTHTLNFNVQGIAGESLDIKALAYTTIGFSVDLLAVGTYCTIVSTGSLAGVCDTPANMPNLSQKDFLMDIIQRFNLAVVADETNNKNLTVMPWSDYISLGERKDWTQKLDLSQERVISPTTKFKKQFIRFSDLEDDDNRNVANQNTYGSVFGNFEQKINGDFLIGNLENKPIFSPFHVNPVPRQDNSSITDAPNLVIHQSYSYGTEGPLASCKPKLFYHNGLEQLEQNDRIYIGLTESYNYPLCLPYYNAGAQMAVDSPMLSWQFQTPNSWGGAIFGTTPSSEGYFKRYWQQFLASYYDTDARVLDCSLYLTASDIHNFQFNDEVVIEDTAYRVLKIQNYQPNTNVPTKVQLLKKVFSIGALQIADDFSDCVASPVSLLSSGIVQFQNDQTGAVVQSEICCNDYNYFWDGSECFWNYGGGGGGSGDPTTGLGGWNPHGVPNDDTIGGISDLKGVGGFHTRKRDGVGNINPVLGEHSTRGQNVESIANSVNKTFVYYATSKSTTATIATPNGISGETSGLQIPLDTMARFIVRALSVQTHVLTGGSGSYGSSAFQVWTFLVKNVGGTITVVGGSEQTDFQEADADAGTRTLDIVGAAGKGGFAGNRGVNIECTGPTASLIAWHLDCEVTYVDFGFTKSLDNLILTEDLNYLITENGYYLEQE